MCIYMSIFHKTNKFQSKICQRGSFIILMCNKVILNMTSLNCDIYIFIKLLRTNKILFQTMWYILALL